MSTPPSIFTADQSRTNRRLRFNPLRALTGPTLSQALDGFENGNLKGAVLLWQAMCERDDILAAVKPKREKAVSRREWDVLTMNDSATAKRHAKALKDFWNNIEVRDAYDRNRTGGFSLLVRQMMEAVSFRYSAHHIWWQPSPGALSATFEAVPLWFFENLTGRLRFVPDGMAYEGQEIAERDWLITCGDGLMMSGSIGYFAKRAALQDWLVFSQDYGTPKVVGRTSQSRDSEGGRAMAEAVETFGNDWRSVIYGDDGSGKIELLTVNGSASVLPMPALIDRVDRRLSALYRGADLSTLSSGAGSEGRGASVQGEEGDILEIDDALTISETLNRVERQVIEWYFGRGVRPQAYIRLLVPQREDLKLLLEVVRTLVDLGVPFAVAEVLERFGWSVPAAGADLLKKAAAPDAPLEDPGLEPQINAAEEEAQEQAFLANAARLLAKASREDRTELVAGMREVLRAPAAQQLNALTDFVARLPAQIGKDSAQVQAWETFLSTSLVNGWGRA